MASAQLGTVLQQIRRMVSKKNGDTLTDIQLLDEFRASKDQAAFAVLLKRHGPMVLEVCRHVLHHHQDAEDVFQATFLVLARKAATIRKKTALASWLHGVAYRMAMNAKRSAARRRKHEGRTGVPPVSATSGTPVARVKDPAWELGWREVQAILDEEIERLPEKYRAVFVLCCLEGIGRAEAGRQFGLKEGTVSSRLDQARKRLQQRLARRGVTLSSVLAAAALAQNAATAALPPFLMNGTVRAAQLIAAGQPGAAGAISTNVAALVQRASRAMVITKLRIGTALLLALGALAGGAGFAAHQVSVDFRSLEDFGSLPRQEAAKPAEVAQQAPVAEKQTHTDRYGDPLPDRALVRMGTIRLRHRAEISCVAFSPDGKTLAASDFATDIRFWDVTTGKEVRRLKTTRGATRFALSPDGATLASCGHENHSVIWLWDTATGNERRQLHGHAYVESLAFSPDGKTLAAGAGVQGIDLGIWLWDVGSGRQLRQFQGHTAPITSVVFSADSKSLASASDDTTVRLWSTTTALELHQLVGHEGKVRSVAFSPDGKTLASGSEDETVRFWDAATGKELHRCEGHRYDVRSVVFSPDGKTVASGRLDGTIRLWDVTRGKECGRLLEAGSIESLAFSPDGKVLASGSQDSTIRLWDVRTGKLLDRAAGSGGIWSIALSPNCLTLASAGDDGVIRLWDPATGRELRQLRGHGSAILRGLTFSPDGTTLASASPDQTVRLWEVSTGKQLRQFGLPDRITTSLAFVSGGKFLARGGLDGTVRLWDTETGKELRQFRGGGKEIAFSPDGKIVALAKSANVLQLFEVASGKESALLHGQLEVNANIHCLTFSQDASQLAWPGWSGGAATILIWDLRKKKEICRLQGHRGEVCCLAFGPDGKTLASAAFGDPTIRLWEVATGKEIGRFQGHQGWITSLVFSPSGALLFSGSRDTTVLAWDVTGRMKIGRLPALSREEIEALWADLAAKDAAKAHGAIWKLVAAPGQSVPLLRQRLQPGPPGDSGRIARLIADLDGAQFSVRDKAASELEKLGELAEPALRKTLAGRPSAEVRRRIEPLLTRLEEWSPERLQRCRALEVLEHIGTPRASEVLQTLAKGEPEAWLTQEAKAALDRLAKLPAGKP